MPKESKDINPTSEFENIVADLVLDAKGLYCPEPVMMLHNKIKDIEIGQVLEIEATDPSTVRDVPKFCLYLGHTLLSQSEENGIYRYHIRKQQE